MFVLFDTLRPSQQYFSYAGTGLPGLKDKCVLLKDRPVGSNYRLGGHRYENFRAQMRNLLRLRYEKDGGKDMEIIWRTHVETMRGGGGGTDVKMIEGG